MDSTKVRVIWVEKMALTDVLLFLVKSQFVEIKVNYDESLADPLAVKLIGVLQRPGGRRVFFPAELTLHRTDERGLALIFKVYKELDACIEDFFEIDIPEEPPRSRAMIKSYLAEKLKDKFIFITMVAGEANVIYLGRGPFNYMVRRFYAGRGIIVKSPVDPMGCIKFYYSSFVMAAYFILCKLRGSAVKGSILGIRPAIWAEYYPSHIHSFWMDTVKAKDFDIVNYLDRSDTPITKETTDAIEKRGIKWIDARLPALIKMSGSCWGGFIKVAGGLFPALFSKPAWLGALRFEYSFLSSIYESVFRRYKVKILIQHQEASWKQEAQASAIERAGGIMAGYHWSAYTSYLLPTHLFPQHVYFVWGKIMSELLEKKGNTCRHILPSGVWVLPVGDDHADEKAFAGNVDFAISVFDDSAGYRLYNSPATLSEFYLRMFGIVERNPRFGCIIKSKQPLHKLLLSLSSGKEILDKLEMLRKQERLVVLDHSLSPLVAASSSDLCVGYGINSACAIAAAIGNRPAINWDCSGFAKHPFHKYADQKIVFNTLDELEEAILKASKGDKAVGDYGRWKKCINYFEDLSAIDRINGFFENYMNESAKMEDPERSLAVAVKRYMDDNKVGRKFNQKEDIWENE
ncbi:MAG: hypothetical protein WC369_03820 [Dehalococcoidales bacterium]|nr:hypothetical protein [Candidatus Omnitrophota bacterium]